jgi:hypothetical protein
MSRSRFSPSDPSSSALLKMRAPSSAYTAFTRRYDELMRFSCTITACAPATTPCSTVSARSERRALLRKICSLSSLMRCSRSRRRTAYVPASISSLEGGCSPAGGCTCSCSGSSPSISSSCAMARPATSATRATEIESATTLRIRFPRHTKSSGRIDVAVSRTSSDSASGILLETERAIPTRFCPVNAHGGHSRGLTSVNVCT